MKSKCIFLCEVLNVIFLIKPIFIGLIFIKILAHSTKRMKKLSNMHEGKKHQKQAKGKYTLFLFVHDRFWTYEDIMKTHS